MAGPDPKQPFDALESGPLAFEFTGAARFYRAAPGGMMGSAYLARQVVKERVKAGELRANGLQLRCSVIPKHYMDNVAVFDKVFDDRDKVFVSSYERDFINAFPNLSGVDVLGDLMRYRNINFLLFSREIFFVGFYFKPLALNHLPESVTWRWRAPELRAPNFCFIAADELVKFPVIKLPASINNLVVHSINVCLGSWYLFRNSGGSTPFGKNIGIVDIGEVEDLSHIVLRELWAELIVGDRSVQEAGSLSSKLANRTSQLPCQNVVFKRKVFTRQVSTQLRRGRLPLY